MKPEKESRAALPLEIRADDDRPGFKKVAGYAAIFDEWADIGGYFLERIAPGAFEGRLDDDVQFLIGHRDLPLARTTSGTLKLGVDARGLWMESDLDATDPDVARIIPKMQRGDLNKMSFGFTVAKEEWDETGDIPRRTITQIGQLLDVSVVPSPAYNGTEIALRSLAAHRADQSAENSHPRRARRMRMALALSGNA